MSNPKLFAYSSESKVTATNPTGNVIAGPLSVSTSPPSYRALPEYSFTDTAANGNSVALSVKSIKDKSDDVDSFITMPVASVGLIADTNLQGWNPSRFGTTNTKIVNGLYIDSNGGTSEYFTAMSTANLANSYDQKYSTKATFDLTASNNPSGSFGILALKIGLPEIDPTASFDFDAVYLGIRAKHRIKHSSTYAGQPAIYLSVVSKRFSVSGKEDIYHGSGASGAQFRTIDSILDAYYLPSDPSPSSDDANFRIKQDTATISDPWNTTGFQNFKLPSITGPSNYGMVRQLGLFFCFSDCTFDAGDLCGLDLYELCLIFHKTASVGDSVFSPLSGRTFAGPGDTGATVWGGSSRNPVRTGNSVISNPVDMLEHLCRLQNFDYPNPSLQAGKAYATAPRINTATTRGGFDYSGLSTIRYLAPAFQAHDLAATDIKKLKTDLCKTFFMTNFTDAQGRENVLPLDFDPYSVNALMPAGFPTGYGTPRVIGLEHLYGRESTIKGADPAYCWSTPFINYNYDYGPGKYMSTVGIVDPTAATFGPECVTGFLPADLGDAEHSYSNGWVKSLWQQCRRLYTTYGNLEKPSKSQVTDRYMIRSYADACWHIVHLVDWMLRRQRRITVPLEYVAGDGLCEGLVIALWLADWKFVETTDNRGGNVYAIVENIGADKNGNTVTVDLVLIEPV